MSVYGVTVSLRLLTAWFRVTVMNWKRAKKLP